RDTDDSSIMMGDFMGRRPILIATGLLWGGAILFGARVLLSYENTPGAPGRPPSMWPAETAIARGGNRFTLVMLAHPNCPCSRASLVELDHIMASSQGNLTAHVIFSKPGADRAEIESTALWRQAARIPGVVPWFDQSGLETQRFGGEVSG